MAAGRARRPDERRRVRRHARSVRQRSRGARGRRDARQPQGVGPPRGARTGRRRLPAARHPERRDRTARAPAARRDAAHPDDRRRRALPRRRRHRAAAPRRGPHAIRRQRRRGPPRRPADQRTAAPVGGQRAGSRTVTGWFDALPLHRKLITMALAVSTAALSAALIGLVAFDVLRFRQSAADDALALAQVIAENAAATIVFNDAQNARQMLDSVQVRPFISRACLYRAGGSLLAGFERPGSAPCPVVPADARTWRAVASRVAVARNGRVVGSIFVERRLDDLPGRVIATASAGLFMLLVAGVVAFGVARRLQATISRPIVSLANAARAIGRDQHAPMPTIEAPPDETGALVDAFSEMVRRLLSSNEALTMEVEERRRMQAEREALLVREREANRLKDEFLAAVSHELRTPLNAIMGWTQVLANMKPEDRGGPTLAKAIASLSRNAHAQSRVIEDLLDVSRIVTGKLQLKVAAVDLRAVIESALDVVAPIAAAKRVRLDVDLPPAASMIR